MRWIDFIRIISTILPANLLVTQKKCEFMINLIIRQEDTIYFKEIYEVNTRAFGQENEARLVERLRQSEVFVPELSIVAIVDKEVVGYILFSKIKIVDDSQQCFDSLALAPMPVRPQYQNKGIGRQLIKYGLAKAGTLGYGSAIVLGHEHYYPKFGFVPASCWHIKPPFEVSENVFMAIELVGNGLKEVSGIVIYPKTFDVV